MDMAIDMPNRYLLEENIEDIIVRLPVKDITRCKCLSKSWFHLITSKHFIRKHLANGDESFIALFVNGRSLNCNQWFFDVCRYDDLKDLSQTMRPPDALHHMEDSLILIGVCNGIVCFTDNKTTILLANPSLAEVKTVDLPPVVGEKCKLVGFGIDNIALNLKFVRIMRFYDDEGRKQQAAEVYNIARNSWTMLGEGEGEVPLVVKYSSQYSTFFNGNLHWCVAGKESSGRILTFNLETHLFQLMELPQRSLCIHQLKCSSLLVLNQASLAFASYPEPSGCPDYVNVWKMNRYGIAETWTKLYKIGPLHHFQQSWCFWKNTFIYEESSGKLISYDLLDQSKTVLCRKVPCHWRFFECRASLISINDF